jgi:hypothetical protein
MVEAAGKRAMLKEQSWNRKRGMTSVTLNIGPHGNGNGNIERRFLPTALREIDNDHNPAIR